MIFYFFDHFQAFFLKTGTVWYLSWHGSRWPFFWKPVCPVPIPLVCMTWQSLPETVQFHSCEIKKRRISNSIRTPETCIIIYIRPFWVVTGRNWAKLWNLNIMFFSLELVRKYPLGLMVKYQTLYRDPC